MTLPELSPDKEILGEGPVIATRASRLFVRTVAVALCLLIGWSAMAKLDRVTRGPGRIVSQEKNSVVQHLEGGIITQILVEEGQTVAEGDILMRIENSFAAAELASSDLETRSLRLKAARLEAETKGAAELVLDADLITKFPAQAAQQQRLFQRRQDEQAEQLKIIDDQIDQRKFELSEKQSRLYNKRRERALMQERLISLRELSAEGAIPRNELLQNETLFQQVVTEISDLEHQILQTEAALEEVRGRRREAILSFKSEAERELADTQIAISKLEETVLAYEDRRLRFDVTAPTSGTINKLLVRNVGGVVKPGQSIAEIVPDDARIEIEAKLSPRDRAHVWPGLKSVVKISAYDFTRYGGLNGRVVEVSPDALQDEQGNIYFRVRIEADGEGLGANNPIVPGMQAEVDIITGRQTVLNYLLRPIRNISARAMRE